MRTIRAYSKPTHYTKINHMAGHIYNKPEGVEDVWYAITDKNNQEVIEHCKSICESRGITLGKIFVETNQSSGFYAGAKGEGEVIYA